MGFFYYCALGQIRPHGPKNFASYVPSPFCRQRSEEFTRKRRKLSGSGGGGGDCGGGGGGGGRAPHLPDCSIVLLGQPTTKSLPLSISIRSWKFDGSSIDIFSLLLFSFHFRLTRARSSGTCVMAWCSCVNQLYITHAVQYVHDGGREEFLLATKSPQVIMVQALPAPSPSSQRCQIGVSKARFGKKNQRSVAKKLCKDPEKVLKSGCFCVLSGIF